MAQRLRCGSDIGLGTGRCKRDHFSRSKAFSVQMALRNVAIPQSHLSARRGLCMVSCTKESLPCPARQTTSSYHKYEIRKRDPDPKTTALLVIDMQNYFSTMAEPILGNVITTIDLCRRASIPVFFTRHNHKSITDYGMLGEWSNDGMILDGSEGAELMPEIRQQVLGIGGEILEKNTYSAFVNTRLKEKLEEVGVEEVIVTGVMTNLCCETTARDAFVRGFRVFFSTDATATANEELQHSTLMNLAFGFAYLIDCHRLRTALLLD